MKKSIPKLICCVALLCGILSIACLIYANVSKNTQQNISFSTSTEDVTYPGTTYSVLTVTASPDGEGTLMQIGTICKTPHGIVKDSTFSKSVEDIDESYTWKTNEICTFLYIYDTEHQNYKLSASYNSAESIVSSAIPYLRTEGDNTGAGIDTDIRREQISADKCDAKKAIEFFNQGKIYQSHVSELDIKDCDGQTIHTVRLKHPESAEKLGYKN